MGHWLRSLDTGNLHYIGTKTFQRLAETKAFDIKVTDILFVNREARKHMDNIFEELASKVPEKTKNLDKVEEVTIEHFLANILPKVESLEVMFENSHSGNLVSLIAPVDLTARNLFKWPNNFSWSYNGEVADSIKERVKAAGGKVDGDLRCSLSWFNFDDLDLHMLEPDGYRIYFGTKRTPSPKTRGTLDVDMNAGGGSTRIPVENICYPSRKNMIEGTYTLIVNNYSKRETVDVGFEVEVEFDGVIHTFTYPKSLATREDVTVAKIKYLKGSFEIIQSLPSSQSVKEIWGISTQKFHKVFVLMLSPNHWGDKPTGNKHYFFMLEGCLNEGKARGFFNEFFSEDLKEHRKALELVGSKMKTDESTNQLSGLGFSSTQRASILCRVKGSFTRVLKINF